MTDSISLEYLVLRCSNVERSRVFYTALGLVLVPERHGNGAPHFACTLGEFVLELYPAGDWGPSAVRIGLRVASIEESIANVRNVGGDVVRVSSDALPRSALLRDPDGNDVALSEPDAPR